MPLSLRHWRQANGLSQRALGAKLGVTATAISNWECGRTVPTAAHRRALVALIGGAPADVIVAEPPRVIARSTCPPDPSADDSFGSYARRCRKAAKVSLYALSRAVKLAPVEIQAIEAGAQPPRHREQLARWAAALGVEPAVFLEHAIAPPPVARGDR